MVKVGSEEFHRMRSECSKRLWENPEYREKVTDSHKGHYPSDETRRKLSEARTGKPSGMKGKVQTAESRGKISECQIGHKVSEETRRKISDALKGQPFTDERRRNISNALKGNIPSEEARRKIGEAHRGMKRSAAACKKMSEVAIGRVRSTETRERMSIAKKKMFQDDMAYVSMMAKSWGIKPNKPETFLINLLDSLYPGEWKYTGDFSFMVNGKSPDFVNCNGQKKIIELFGDYWHKGQDPQDRINTFAPFGFDTLVIWEHELKDIGAVKTKLAAFNLRKDTLECNLQYQEKRCD